MSLSVSLENDWECFQLESTLDYEKTEEIDCN